MNENNNLFVSVINLVIFWIVFIRSFLSALDTFGWCIKTSTISYLLSENDLLSMISYNSTIPKTSASTNFTPILLDRFWIILSIDFYLEKNIPI